MIYELEVISDIIYNGGKKPKIIKKNDKIKKLFDISDIEVEEYIDPKTGKHIKKYSTVLHNNNYYKINKPYEELKTIKLNNMIPIVGLISKSRNYESRNT